MVKTVDLDACSKELAFLFAILGFENNPGRLEQLMRNEQELDWEQFLVLVDHHRVYPVVYATLKKIEHHIVPPHILSALHTRYSQNTFRMLYLTGEMERISRALSDAGVHLLMMKGPVLAHKLYGDLSLRTSKDLDVLVPPHMAEAADHVLTSQGYVSLENKKKKDRKKDHHLTYRHVQSNAEIELHWRLNRETGREPDFSELWSRRQKSAITTFPVYCLGDEDLFFYLLTHGARHGWFRLRWLDDLDHMLKHDLDWREINDRLHEFKFTHLKDHTLLLASRLLGTPIKHAERLKEDKRSVMLANLALQSISGENVSKYRYTIKSPRQKVKHVLELFVPKARDKEMLALPESLSILYFPLRPVLWFCRRCKQWFLTKSN
ncbi:Renal dipeptidase [Xylanibacillus composti]|uniref:Uncharacterized protein n=1 Tax=Xylanibacillus composti TaxID=1572762 RepID=A0A8J4H521_9BACL|nr:nucleotidyltransferase family protein [Xylanibacillus composti]MDT9724513.1 Renal dipeptidase [Xylanibacillus composti]GIQ69776.1 hypothetical protein XYCOK13_26000 [Xylanibacillus composti]